jgi:hypothetical protein
VLRGAGPTTGVTIVSGERCVAAWNGSDFVKVASTVTPASSITGLVAVANGGTGTATPALVAGSNVVITGTWPNQTIAAAAPGTGTVTSVAGTGSANGLSLSGTVTSTGNITLGGAVTSLTTTNFTIEESGGKLVFKYGATTIASMDSSGNIISAANVTAYGTP